jgi:hypothetical protein
VLATWGTSTGRNPTLDLQFAGATSLDNRITFSRGSQATLFDSAGTLVYAKHNLFLQSQSFDTTWATTNASVTANNQSAPDGTATADTIVRSGTVNSSVAQSFTATPVTYVASVFAKAGTQNFLALQVNTNGVTRASFITFDLTNGSIGTEQTLTTNVGLTATATSLSNGWYRCSVSYTSLGGTDNILFNPSNAANSRNGIDTGTVILWGAQLNLAGMEGGVTSSLATYYPTTTAAYYAPRFDYNPSTLAAQGLLIEEQRTNSIRNNTMQGAVAGTPGTLPTNWAVSNLGTLATAVIGTGTENGITYIDLKISGTTSTTGGQINFEAITATAAAVSQTWTHSTYCTLAAGSMTNVTSIGVNIGEYDVGSSFLAQGSQTFTPTAANLNVSRRTLTRTLSNASTAYIRPWIAVNFSSGVAIDITLRIGLPQLEQGAFATSVIPTTTTALTRNADVASMTGTNFSSWFNAAEGTLLAQVIYGADVNCKTAFINNGAYTNLFSMQREASLDRWQVDVFSGGSRQALLTFATNSAAINSVSKCASAYKVDDFSGSVNGGTVVTDTSGLVPVSMDRLALGRDNVGSAEFLNGWLQRISYYPVRLPNSTLQALTA